MTAHDPLWRRTARAVKRTPERMLHASRRAAATRRVQALVGPQRLLFVCFGNICRSPYGHYRAQQMLAGTPHLVRSGGFVGPGRHSPDEAQEAARERQLDLAAHISGPLPASLVRDSTLIVVMDEEQATRINVLLDGAPAAVELLGDFDPEPIETRVVLDPWGKPLEDFRRCYARIDRCLDVLIGALRR